MRAGWTNYRHGTRSLTPLLLALATLLPPGQTVTAQEARPMKTQKPAAEQEKSDVSLRRVVLFSSGVGYFEQSGQVSGNSDISLKFEVDDINDLLKSLVVQDLGGGTISAVTYESRDPVTRTLQTFSVDLTENVGMAELLQQIRGAAITVAVPDEVSGKILSVEKRKRKVDDEILEETVLNLFTDGGQLRSIPLSQVESLRLQDEKLNAEFLQALAVLASRNSNDQKTVQLAFRGEGERQVRLGYIQETPVWKTSYRLVLDDDKAPHMQGWAIVENTTESDWSDVALTLISGRPVSFRMDLYEPLYVQRPLVVPELYSSLAPKVYDQDMDGTEADFRRMARPEGEAMQEQLAGSRARKARSGLRRHSVDGPGPGVMMAAPAAPAGGFGGGAAMDMSGSVQSLADAGDVGELFQYRIDEAVSIGRRKSAMLPIVNAEVEGEKLSIYSPQTHPKHPMNGLRLKNSTDLHLMQGPVTVFDGGAYAGDARLPDLPPKSERLVSYALDLDVEVAPDLSTSASSLMGVWIRQGTLHTVHKLQQTRQYTVKNSGSRTRKVLIEQPFEADWALLEPAMPEEKTRDLYRFAVEAKPGVPAKLLVKEERYNHETIALTSLNDRHLRIYISGKTVSQDVREALEEIVRRKAAISELLARRNRLEQQISTTRQEQEPIRKNMEQLDRESALYKRYVRKFTDQEDAIETAQAEIEKLKDEGAKLQQELNEYLGSLKLGEPAPTESAAPKPPAAP